ncbi:MAG: GTP-binding protein [Pseudomonadota bacterium]
MSLDGTGDIPVSILTGFLGSGKTTLLNQLIQTSGLQRTLVLINEFGEVGLDHQLVAFSHSDVVIEMSSGCLCCTIRGDLAKTLRDAPARFARGGERWFDRVVIETTGLADPAPILHTLMNDPGVAQRYRLDGVIATVDAVNGHKTLDSQIESVKQAAMADRLVLTKTDLADDLALARLKERLYQLNPAAPQNIADQGVLDPALLFDAGLYDPSTKSLAVRDWLHAEAYASDDDHHHGHNVDHGHHHDVNRHDKDIRAVCITLDDPIRADVLEYWLGTLLELRGEDCLRIKGIVNVDEHDQPLVIHGVQHLFHPPVQLEDWPDDDHRSRLVFITRNIDATFLQSLLSTIDESIDQRTQRSPFRPNTIKQRFAGWKP